MGTFYDAVIGTIRLESLEFEVLVNSEHTLILVPLFLLQSNEGLTHSALSTVLSLTLKHRVYQRQLIWYLNTLKYPVFSSVQTASST